MSMKEWTKALRSGEYEQGTGYLKTTDGGALFCCLGVGQACVSGAGAIESYSDTHPDGRFIEWLDWKTDSNGELLDPDMAYEIQVEIGPLREEGKPVTNFAGWVSLADLNDTVRLTFDEIADLLDHRNIRVLPA